MCVCVRVPRVCIKGLACSADYAYHIFIIKFMAPIMFHIPILFMVWGEGAEG